MYRVSKRALDIVGAVGGLVFAAPVILLAALVVRWSMGSPVVFRHRRPGFKERPFDCLKFRTMTNECDSNRCLLSDAQRLTPIGEFFRRTSIDELPQLWNVLKGEMSLVGPRPLEFRYLRRYSPAQRRRHDVMPGITGWAQVCGRNAINWERKFELDLWYVDNCSFWLDLKILAMTFWKVVFAKGIREPGQATASEFWGEERNSSAMSDRAASSVGDFDVR